ncbi:MAG: tripartite tricarboxylate transporter substrate binding protein [Burkholderiales bacterium]|nr:tripartite tricarboxylate transporter substrate binding protein [Burkholderiales bacterium]
MTIDVDAGSGRGGGSKTPFTLTRVVRQVCAVSAVVAGAALGAIAAPAWCQGDPFPNRPVRLIVPFPPGGGNDILARAVGQRMGEIMRQQVIVDNRGGAGGMIGGSIAASANPDGYTLLLGSLGGLAHNPALRPNLPYDPVRDFAPVSLLATSPFMLVAYPQVPARSLKELLALARAKPGTLNLGSAGVGSSLHMTGELFKHATGTNLVHVPFKGTALAMTDLMSGQIHLLFSTMPPALPQVKAGKLRALGVTSAKRAASAPDVPTIIEGGVAGFEVLNWQGLVVPRKTPAAIVARLNRDVLAALALPGMNEALAAQGLDAAGGAAEAFGKLIADEIVRYKRLVKAAGIPAE